MTEAIEKAQEAVLWGCRTMVDKGYVLGTAGNISVKVEGEDLFVITPTSHSYASLTPEDLVTVDMQGNVVAGKHKPSMEYLIHLNLFVLRPEINGVVHTHSKYATVVSAIREIEKVPLLDIETMSYIGGDIAIAPFASPGSVQLADNIKSSIGFNSGIVMESHGAVGIGTNIEKAMIACDNIERTCELYWAILATGLTPKTLPESYLATARVISLGRRNISIPR